VFKIRAYPCNLGERLSIEGCGPERLLHALPCIAWHSEAKYKKRFLQIGRLFN